MDMYKYGRLAIQITKNNFMLNCKHLKFDTFDFKLIPMCYLWWGIAGFKAFWSFLLYSVGNQVSDSLWRPKRSFGKRNIIHCMLASKYSTIQYYLTAIIFHPVQRLEMLLLSSLSLNNAYNACD